MFKQEERLTKVEFSNFFRVGKRHHFNHFTIITIPKPFLKVAVVVGKKVAKSAVQRNTFKRRILATLKTTFKKNNTTGIFIIVVKPTYNTLNRRIADELLRTSIAQVIKST